MQQQQQQQQNPKKIRDALSSISPKETLLCFAFILAAAVWPTSEWDICVCVYTGAPKTTTSSTFPLKSDDEMRFSLYILMICTCQRVFPLLPMCHWLFFLSFLPPPPPPHDSHKKTKIFLLLLLLLLLRQCVATREKYDKNVQSLGLKKKKKKKKKRPTARAY